MNDFMEDGASATRNPAEVLGVEPDATEAQIRDAYLRLVKLHTPEHDPGRFEEIRDAYLVMKDPRRRARAYLNTEPECGPLREWFERSVMSRELRHAGPQAWLAAIRDGRRA